MISGSPSLLLSPVGGFSLLPVAPSPEQHQRHGTFPSSPCCQTFHTETSSVCAQGCSWAPQMVGEALKGGRLVAAVMTAAGFEAVPPPAEGGSPAPAERQHAFITAVKLGSREALLAFCAAVQRCSLVGAFVEPVPGAARAQG